MGAKNEENTEKDDAIHMCMRMLFVCCVAGKMHARLSFLTLVSRHSFSSSSECVHESCRMLIPAPPLPLGVQCNSISTQSSLTLCACARVSVAAGCLCIRVRGKEEEEEEEDGNRFLSGGVWRKNRVRGETRKVGKKHGEKNETSPSGLWMPETMSARRDMLSGSATNTRCVRQYY